MRLSELMIEDFPEEARRVYHAKEGEKVSWEHRPDGGESGDTVVYFCDTCKSYHVDAYERGYRVEPGRIVDVLWRFDAYEDIDESDWCNVDSDDYEAFLDSNSFMSRQCSWMKYYEHVLETGKDPVNNFIDKNEDVLKTRTEESIQHLKKALNEETERKNLRLHTKKYIKTADRLVHEAVYSNTGYWKTMCKQYVETPDTESYEFITCLACLALR